MEDEIKRVKKHQMNLQLEQKKPTAAELKAFRSKNVGIKSVTDTFTGSVQLFETHAYFLDVTAEGTLEVNTTNDPESYEVLDASTFEPVSPGQKITPGGYYLVVYGLNPDDTSYSIQLSGFTFNADSTLPQLDVTYPKPYTRLNKGVKSFTATGSTQGATKAAYGVNNGQLLSLPVNEPFSKQIQVLTGYNTLDFYSQNDFFNQSIQGNWVVSPGVERLYGADRYITSAQLAKRLPVMSDTVVIAVGTNFPDALSGGALAAWEGAPILLTKTGSLPQAIKDEVKRRGAKRAILLGGADVVSTNVESELKALGVTTIERKEGMDRYATSAAVATALLDSEDQYTGGHSRTAFIVTGNNYADALSASSPAGFSGSPVLLVKGTTLPAPIKQVIESKGIKNFYVIGGADVVSSSIFNQLKTYGGTVKRLEGQDRYKTALAVADEFSNGNAPIVMDWTLYHIAYGGNYPDALSQGPLAAYMGAPLLLTKTSALDPQVDAYLDADGYEPEAFYISGGPDVVSTSVQNRLNSFILP